MRKVIGVLFAIIFVFPLLLGALSVVSISTWIFDRDFYIEVLDNQVFYDSILSDEMVLRMAQESFPQAEGVDAQTMSEVLRTLISPEFLSQQVRYIVNSVFDFLEGKSDLLDLKLDLTPIKQAFSGPQSQELITKLAQAMPVCVEGQEVKSSDAGFYICKPDFISEQVFIENYLTPALPQMLENLPDEIPLGEQVLRETQIPAGPLGDLVFSSSSFYLAVGIVVTLALFFWVITALIAGTNGRQKLMWLGWTLLIPAVFIFILGITVRSDISAVWIRYGMDQAFMRNLPLPADVSAGMYEISQVATGRISNAFLMVSGIAAMLAIGFIAWGAVTRPAPAAVAPPVESEDEVEE